MRAIIEQTDGTVSILIPADGVDINDEMSRLGLSGEIVEETAIPADRTFREAWVKGNKKVDVDMPKARGIHMEKIRKARNKKLAELDIEQLKGNDVAAQKQSLRDLPETFDLSVAETPEQLKALWPEGV